MLILLSLGVTTLNANASTLSTNLQSVLVDVQILDTDLQSISLTSENMCNELLIAHNSAENIISAIESINAGLTSPMSIDADSLQAIDDISNTIVSMANSGINLSNTITTLNSTTEMLAISNGLSSMLRLSTDIGIMADRILQMSDKILLMADNIGLMADRIIITQQIQSDNLALTQSSMLTTQQNLLALVSVISTNDYESDFDSQTFTGNLLSLDISATILSIFNMAREWENIGTDVNALKGQIEATHSAIQTAVQSNTVYLDVASYTDLAEMSIMLNSIAIATQGLALATEGLSPITSDSRLEPSVQSILQISSDIGVMADRILEMADLILAMSDNIGMTADQIIAAQTIQNTNYATSIAAVEMIQTTAITIIAFNNL